MSPQTFEEVATAEVDHLYRGALFLSGGDEEAAEGLLLWTLTRSFHAFRAAKGVSDAARWLEGRLVDEFVAASKAAGVDVDEVWMASPDRPRRQVGNVDARALAVAAARIPFRARAALWLVVLRRWKYEDAARSLGVSGSELKNLLKYRDALVGAVISGPSERNGTDGGTT